MSAGRRRTIADAIEALDGLPVPLRGVECTVHVIETAAGRVPLAVPTVAGRYARAYRSLPPFEAHGPVAGFRMSEADAIAAVILGFGSMHAADRFLAGEGSPA